MEHLVPQKTDNVDFELKKDKKPICSKQYLIPKIHKEIIEKEV